MFKLTSYGLRDFYNNEYFYGNCQYYIFSDGSTYTYPRLEINQAFETRQVDGVDKDFVIYTFFLDTAYNPLVDSGKSSVQINGHAPFVVSNITLTRQVYYSSYPVINIEPCIIYNSKNIFK